MFCHLIESATLLHPLSWATSLVILLLRQDDDDDEYNGKDDDDYDHKVKFGSMKLWRYKDMMIKVKLLSGHSGLTGWP